jgi:hypothetical protein
MVLRRHATAVPTDTPDHRFLGGLGRRTDRARQGGLMESHLSQACPSANAAILLSCTNHELTQPLTPRPLWEIFLGRNRQR